MSRSTAGSFAPGMVLNSSGNVGIGTTTPYSRLEVFGSDAASSTSAFAVVNTASTTVFAVFDGGNAQLSGTLTQSSDQRLKTNIQTLDGSSSLAEINALNPVTFNWIDPNQDEQTPARLHRPASPRHLPEPRLDDLADRAHAQRHPRPQLHRPHIAHRRRDPGA